MKFKSVALETQPPFPRVPQFLIFQKYAHVYESLYLRRSECVLQCGMVGEWVALL